MSVVRHQGVRKKGRTSDEVTKGISEETGKITLKIIYIKKYHREVASFPSR